jgi:hypothetical protein
MAIAKDAKNANGQQQMGDFKIKQTITGKVKSPDAASVMKKGGAGANCAGANNSNGSRPAGQRAAG